MRDTVKTEEYFRERYNEDASDLAEQISKYEEVISHPEKYNVWSFKYHIYMEAACKFYAGYSLGLGMNELLPEVDLIIRNLIDTKRERDRGYDDMEMIIYLIILFNRTEFLDDYKELLQKSKMRDFYLDYLVQTVDPTWQISTEKLRFPKETNSVYEVVVLSKENKAEAVQRLKRYLKRQWFMSLTEGVITNRNLKTGWYRGYWCVAAVALVKALKLDDTELKDCKYYPYDMAHFCEKIMEKSYSACSVLITYGQQFTMVFYFISASLFQAETVQFLYTGFLYVFPV